MGFISKKPCHLTGCRRAEALRKIADIQRKFDDATAKRDKAIKDRQRRNARSSRPR